MTRGSGATEPRTETGTAERKRGFAGASPCARRPSVRLAPINLIMSSYYEKMKRGEKNRV